MKFVKVILIYFLVFLYTKEEEKFSLNISLWNENSNSLIKIKSTSYKYHEFFREILNRCLDSVVWWYKYDE